MQELPSYAETFTPWLHFGWSQLRGMRTKDWKYIEAPKPELYDLSSDPGENRNVIATKAGQAKQMKEWLAKSGATKEIAAQPQPGMDPETLEKLASLGYAGVSAPPKPGGVLADPKDKIEDFKTFNKLIRDGIEAFREERYEQAASSFQELENRKIPSFEVHYYLGRSLLRLKSYDKSRTELQKAIETLPHFLPAYRDLSEAWEGSGRMDEAEKALLAGLVLAPNHPTLVQPLAWLYQRQKKTAAAEQVLIAELKAHPEDIESRFRLGAIYRDSGRPERAIEQYRLILKRNPDDPEAHNQLGMIYGGNNRLQEALTEFTAARKIDPKNEAIGRNIEIIHERMKTGPPAGKTVRFEIIQTKSLAAAESILRKLQSGEKWEELARDYSIHPSARSTDPVLEASTAEIDASLAHALSALKPGEISKPVSGPGGFFLLKRL